MITLLIPTINRSEFIIGFCGSVYWHNVDNMKQLWLAASKILNSRLSVFGSQSTEYLERLGVTGIPISRKFYANPNELREALSKCDVLYLPYTFNPKYKPYMINAFPTKIHDYLLSGRPILVHCPSESYMSKYFVENGAATLYYSNAAKIATSNTGVTVTGAAVGTMTTDNDGSFAMSASNNFKCTPSGSFTLTFTSIVAQSGNILLINSGGHTVSAHSNTKVDANLLATVSTAGTYLLAYFSDGTNVYMTNSAIYT